MMARLGLLRIAALSATIALVFVVAGCGGDEESAPGEETGAAEATGGELPSFELTIGSLVALTGPFATYGPPLDKAANLAADVANEAAAKAGADITVTVESADTESDPQAAVSAARKLVSEGASCLTGTIITPEIVAIAQSVTVARKVPMVLPFASSATVSTIEDDDTIFRTIAPDVLQGLALADVIEEVLGGASGNVVSLAYRNEPYGEGLGTSFTEEWESRGGEVRGPVVFDPEQASYNSEATEIVGGEEDAFLIIDYTDTYARLGPAVVRTGEFDAGKLFVTDTLSLPEIPDTIPAEALEGARGTIASAPEGTPAAQAFDELYTAASGPERIALDANNFDANIVCFLAAVAADSTDPEAMTAEIRNVAGAPGEKYTFEQLSDAIAALANGEDIDYEGVSGPIEFDDNGDLTESQYDVFTYVDGKRVVEKTIDVELESG
jgi:ABC-type branched-subunit amino acid transport system substrate-binding protein